MQQTHDRKRATAQVEALESWTVKPNWTRTYVNTTQDAVAEVEHIVHLLTSGKVHPFAGIDVETSPMPGLEGYPGTQFVEETDPDTGETKLVLVRASKKTYLE